MRLNRAERDWYSVAISTTPPLDGTWQASFDNEVTWIDGTHNDDGTWGWLLAGPDFAAATVGMDPADTDATIAQTVTPRLRVADNPVLDIEIGPRVNLA